MTGFTVPVCFSIWLMCIHLIHAQRLEVSTDNDYASPGEDYDIMCHCNENDVGFYLDYKVVFAHRKRDGTKTIITNNGYLIQPRVSSSYYAVNMTKDQDGWTVRLTVKAVKDTDLGQYICSLQSADGTVLTSETIEFSILHPITDLLLKVGNEEISQTITEYVVYTEGMYEVECETTGSNPEPILDIYIGDTKIHTDNPDVNPDGSLSHFGFKASVKSRLSLSEQHDGQHLKCVASVPHSHYDNMEAGFNIRIIPSPPITACVDSAALVGDSRAVLSCYITAKTDIDCSNILWENGNLPNHLYYPGRKSSDKNEVKCQAMNSTTIKSDLIIHNVSEETMKTTFFLDLVHQERKHRHPVSLALKSGRAGSMRPVTLVIVFLTFTATYINRK